VLWVANLPGRVDGRQKRSMVSPQLDGRRTLYASKENAHSAVEEAGATFLVGVGQAGPQKRVGSKSRLISAAGTRRYLAILVRLAVWAAVAAAVAVAVVALRPLWKFAPECATASEVREVDSSSVIAGGVTAASLPAEIRNFRRSSVSCCSRSSMTASEP
jgi:hypothetical protein